MLVRDHPLLFPSLEDTRYKVRYRRGNAGKDKREVIADKQHFRPCGKAGFVAPQPAVIVPEDIHFDGAQKWLILSDAHIPYHSKEALEIAVNKGVADGCDALYLNGDFSDNYAWSRHFKYPVHETPLEDIRALRDALSQLAGMFDRRVYKMGNHDERWDKYIAQNAPKISLFVGVEFTKQAGIVDNGYEVVESQQLAFIGRAPILHGHEAGNGGYSPVNAAKGAFNRVKDTVIVGHHHRSSNHLEKMGIEGRLIVTRSLGCLCQLQASYQRVTNWNLGFATLEVGSDGKYEFSNYVITHNLEVFRL